MSLDPYFEPWKEVEKHENAINNIYDFWQYVKIHTDIPYQTCKEACDQQTEEANEEHERLLKSFPRLP